MASDYVSLYRQTLAERQRRYDAAIASGQYTPFLYPWDTMPALYILLAIAVAPRLAPMLSRATRYVCFLLVVAHFAYVGAHRRTLSFAGGYIMGIAGAWGIIMSAALLIFNNVAKNFKRLEIRPLEPTINGNHQDRVEVASAMEIAPAVDMTKRKVPGVFTSKDTNQLVSADKEQPATRPYFLVWQGFPYGSDWLHVVDWGADLITNFRGVNWNHRIQTVGEIDAPIPPKPTDQASVAGQNHVPTPTAIPQQTLRTFKLRTLQDFVVTYLVLDFLKTTMMTDPYFLGLVPLESPTPWAWLAHLNHYIPFATRLVRLSTSMVAVVTALTFVYGLSPLFFAVILPSLVDVSRITRSPLLEPWMYPPQWHPLASSVFQSGLAGFWGKFWHQMFRFGISEPSRVLIEKLNLDRRGNAARAIQLLVAFLLSGSLHAAGSYTSFSLRATHPFTGPFLFFLSQALGVLLQLSLAKTLQVYITQTKSLPQAVRQMSNVVFVVLYLYFTGPLLADDFASCGVWLYEPFPISPLRGLGFGPGGKDEGWWAWNQEGAKWISGWRGDSWWQIALAI